MMTMYLLISISLHNQLPNRSFCVRYSAKGPLDAIQLVKKRGLPMSLPARSQQ
jgi:hypothetical protein